MHAQDNHPGAAQLARKQNLHLVLAMQRIQRVSTHLEFGGQQFPGLG